MFTTSPFYWQMERAYARTQEFTGQQNGIEAKRFKSADQISHEEFVMEA